MIEVPCPWCGPRNSMEFRAVGESKRRPDVATTTPAQWRQYLYDKSNRADWVTETWYHRAGCRRYFAVERHTVTNDIRESRPPAAQLRQQNGSGA
jgi:heterotetrameric sarcosine oxidase delta subunit